MGSSVSASRQPTAEEIIRWNSNEIATHLEESGLNDLSKRFQSLAINGETLIFLARIFLDDDHECIYDAAACGDAAAGTPPSEKQRLKTWLKVLFRGVPDSAKENSTRSPSEAEEKGIAPPFVDESKKETEENKESLDIEDVPPNPEIYRSVSIQVGQPEQAVKNDYRVNLSKEVKKSLKEDQPNSQPLAPIKETKPSSPAIGAPALKSSANPLTVASAAGKDGLMFQPGEIIPPSDIEVVRYLASGNFGEVYEAVERVQDESHQYEVKLAMKVVRFATMSETKTADKDKDAAQKNQQLVELCRETRLAMGLSHPVVHQNLVAVRFASICTKQILDETLRLTVLFVDFADGQELEEIIDHRANNGVPEKAPVGFHLYEGPDEHPSVVVGRILGVAYQMASGLAHMHNLGVLHQDIKPANVMIQKNGVVKISDFGLSCRGELVDGVANAVFKGCTPAYRSPEIASLLAALKEHTNDKEMWKKTLHGELLTPCTSDMWAFGLVVLEAFAVGRPWSGYGETAPGGLQKYTERMRLYEWSEEEVANFFKTNQLAAIAEKCKEKQINGNFLFSTSKARLKEICDGKAAIALKAWKAVSNLEKFPIPEQVQVLLKKIFDTDILNRPQSMNQVAEEIHGLQQMKLTQDAEIMPPKVSRQSVAATFANIAQVLKHYNEKEDALGCYQDAVNVSETGAADELMEMGEILRDLERYNESMQSLEKANKIRPQHANTLYSLGATAEMMGNIEDAIQFHRQAADCADDFGLKIDILNDLAIDLQDVQRFEEAIDVLQERIKLDPDDAMSHYQLGKALFQCEKDLQCAIDSFKEAERIFIADEDAAGEQVVQEYIKECEIKMKK